MQSEKPASEYVLKSEHVLKCDVYLKNPTLQYVLSLCSWMVWVWLTNLCQEGTRQLVWVQTT